MYIYVDQEIIQDPVFQWPQGGMLRRSYLEIWGLILIGWRDKFFNYVKLTSFLAEFKCDSQF